MAEQNIPNGNGEARDDASGTAAAFDDTMRGAEDYVKRQWRKNPLGVAAVFAGIGLLLGLMLRRR